MKTDDSSVPEALLLSSACAVAVEGRILTEMEPRISNTNMGNSTFKIGADFKTLGIHL